MEVPWYNTDVYIAYYLQMYSLLLILPKKPIIYTADNHLQVAIAGMNRNTHPSVLLSSFDFVYSEMYTTFIIGILPSYTYK